jgi:LysR family transcriptional regulator of gallate degradation
MAVQPTLRRLAIFDAVMRAGSIGAAAHQIGLSQPSVSHALDKLEAETGARLLERGAAGSFPTKAGRILHRRTERMLRWIELGLEQVMGAGARPLSPASVSRNVTTAQVRAYLAISRLGSFRAAAEALGVAEPTLHRAARELERTVGASLYRRTPQGVSVGPAGHVFAGRLRLALYEIDQALDELAAERGAMGGRVSAGCLPLMPKPALARTVGLLLRDYPAVRVELTEASHETLMAGLRSGELDVVVGALRHPRLGGDVVERALFKDPHVVVARRGHPLAGQAFLDETDLARFPWVAPTRDTPRRAFVEDLFARLPIRPSIAAETSALTIMTAILIESDCLTLLSQSQALHEFQDAGLAVLPIRFQAADRTVGATTRSGWLPTVVQRRFLTLLRQECRRMAQDGGGMEAAPGP